MNVLDWLSDIGPAARGLLPLLSVLAVSAIVLTSARAFIRLRARRAGGSSRAFPFGGQLMMLALTAVAIIAVVVVLPVSEGTRGQLLGLLGLALTAIIALASTTFVTNAMAGLMLRAVGNFRPGDWVRVGDQFGRVTERGLFHTELQTEDRDLTTLPNLYLVTNPVVVVRESGTIVSATLSLGYDRHHAEIEALLVEAARAAGLEDPFVHTLELGDFSVSYRAAGFLPEVKQLLSVRSQLRTNILDVLHGAGVEIVSPTFMNQRRLDASRVLPSAPTSAREPGPPPEAPAPEEIIFDKAEERAALETLTVERERLEAEIRELEASAKDASAEAKASVEAEIASRRSRIEAIASRLERAADGEDPTQR